MRDTNFAVYVIERLSNTPSDINLLFYCWYLNLVTQKQYHASLLILIYECDTNFSHFSLIDYINTSLFQFLMICLSSFWFIIYFYNFDSSLKSFHSSKIDFIFHFLLWKIFFISENRISCFIKYYFMLWKILFLSLKVLFKIYFSKIWKSISFYLINLLFYRKKWKCFLHWKYNTTNKTSILIYNKHVYCSNKTCLLYQQSTFCYLIWNVYIHIVLKFNVSPFRNTDVAQYLYFLETYYFELVSHVN